VPAPRRKLVIATANPGKLREIRSLLADLPFDVYCQSALAVAPAEETGSSFLSNALLKARHAAAAASLSRRSRPVGVPHADQ